MRYRIEEYVRWEDIDAAGIINYQAYLRFFGLAEAELFRAAGLNYRHLSSALGIALPRVHIACDFHRPATFVANTVEETLPEGVASGRYVLVSVRLATFEPVPVPDEIRSRLDPYLETPPAPAR